MKYLLIAFFLIAPINHAQMLPQELDLFPKLTEPLPEHMVYPSMKEMFYSTQLVADVTVENSQDGYELTYWSFGNPNQTEPFTESYILHEVSINKVVYDSHLDPSWQQDLSEESKRNYSENPTAIVGDRFYVRQWGNLRGKHYEGVPVLGFGNEYRLYLWDDHDTEETTGAKIYAIVGQNGGIFRKEGDRLYRDKDNSSKLVN